MSELLVDLDDGPGDEDMHRLAVEVDVLPLQRAHLTPPTAGGGEEAKHQRILRVA